MELVVYSVRREAAAVRSIVLGLPDGGDLPPWEPGNHIDVSIPGVGQRSYSLCSDPENLALYRIAILLEPLSRGGSQYMHQLEVGQRVECSLPKGGFHFALERPRYVFVAGGIGVTAILPMVRSVANAGLPLRVYYLGRTRESLAFIEELNTYATDFVLWLTEERRSRFPLPRMIAHALPDSGIYCCGPEGLSSDLRELAWSQPGLSFSMERFSRSEKAKTLENDSTDVAFEVVCRRSSKRVMVSPGQSILSALEGSGLPVASSCREGFCGTCELRVISGVPDHRDDILSPSDRAKGDRVFVCVSRALSSEIVLDV